MIRVILQLLSGGGVTGGPCLLCRHHLPDLDVHRCPAAEGILLGRPDLFFLGFHRRLLLLPRLSSGRASNPLAGFELPGAADRRQIARLKAEIHHLDKAHLHLQLGDIYFSQGKLADAEASYRAAYARDPQDEDIRAHLGNCLARRGQPQEALPLLEGVCAQNPKHDYGYTLMTLAEAQTAAGQTDRALATWRQVLGPLSIFPRPGPVRRVADEDRRDRRRRGRTSTRSSTKGPMRPSSSAGAKRSGSGAPRRLRRQIAG